MSSIMCRGESCFMLRGNSNGAEVTDCKGERQVDKSECNVKLLQYTMQFNEANPRAASCLGIAARVGDEEAVKSLLKRRRRIDIGDNRGWTPLHEAAAASSIGCLSLLLKKGRKFVNVRTMEGETSLLLACMHQDSTEVVSMLLDHGADVDLGNNEDHTPLHEVCGNGKVQVAVILIAYGAKLNALNFNNFTPLHCAVSSANTILVRHLISKGADVSIQDESGRTPLFIASQLGNWDVVETILAACHTVDTRAADGATALMVATQNGNLKVIEELLKRGANPDLACHNHIMALHHAIHYGHLSVVKLLLKVTNREALIHHCTHPDADVSCSLCCLAIDGEHLNVLKLLLSSDLGDDILHLPVHCLQTGPGNDPHVALQYSEFSPVSFLLSTKLDTLQDDALIYLELLLKHGFPVNVTRKKALPPLVAAMLELRQSHLKSRCVDMLLAYGADVEYTTTPAGVPDALLVACLSGQCSGLLQLLRAGSSGSPNDLLRHLVTHNQQVQRIDTLVVDMTELLLSLGITEPDLYRQVQHYFPENRKNIQIKADAAVLAPLQVCSLQQMCRLAVRQYLGQPLIPALEKLSIPHIIKKYLMYKTL